MHRNSNNGVGLISKSTPTRGKVDETYIKIKKTWMYLYRAVDSQGNTLEFLLSTSRDAEAAKRFFLKALHFTAGSDPQAHPVEEQIAQPTVAAPRVINVDKNAASRHPPLLISKPPENFLCLSNESLVKYLNNLIEQDHRAHQTAGQAWTGFLFH